jgi:hypothetical protein
MSTSRMGWLWVVATAVSLLATVAGQQALEQKQESAPPAAQQAENNDQKQEKKKDKKKKDKSGGQDVLNTEVFSETVANTVLRDVKDGLEGHSQRLLLSAFDPDKMDGYLAFEDQMEAFFSRYESFRVHYRIVQTTVEGPRAIVLADVQMEVIPRGGGAAPSRRNEQLRFELERGRKGWKIVDFRPRSFFS